MADTKSLKSQTHGVEEGLSKEEQELLLALPKDKGWITQYLYKFQGQWSQASHILAVNSAQRHFKAFDTDLILSSFPKSGTTWSKALMFAIVNRKKFTPVDNPLLTVNPLELVPMLEYDLYANSQVPDITNIPPPRIFGTHIHYSSLPESIKTSNSKIVYISRNPLDTFVSLWHFTCKARSKHLEPLTIEDAFDLFCRGVSAWGPFWDHVLGYWKASLENPDKILFLKYEDMKADIISSVDHLAEFLGYPFSTEEKNDGVIEEISKLCSFENLKELEPNKTGRLKNNIEKKTFFRKGMVGDWVNYLTLPMAEQLNKIVEEKLKGSGLSFNASC